jgi:hypothetical protein
MHTRRLLAEGLGVTVSDFVCCARILASANHVLFFHPDYPY